MAISQSIKELQFRKKDLKISPCPFHSRFEENQTFTGRLTTFISETYPVLSGNWSFFLNAPSGGIITQFIRQGNTDNGVMIGGCQEDYPETEYSKCRKVILVLDFGIMLQIFNLKAHLAFFFSLGLCLPH